MNLHIVQNDSGNETCDDERDTIPVPRPRWLDDVESYLEGDSNFVSSEQTNEAAAFLRSDTETMLPPPGDERTTREVLAELGEVLEQTRDTLSPGPVSWMEQIERDLEAVG